jgi:hypothetical protein
MSGVTALAATSEYSHHPNVKEKDFWRQARNAVSPHLAVLLRAAVAIGNAAPCSLPSGLPGAEMAGKKGEGRLPAHAPAFAPCEEGIGPRALDPQH